MKGPTMTVSPSAKRYTPCSPDSNLPFEREMPVCILFFCSTLKSGENAI